MRFLDLKKGPKKDVILLEIKEENFNPKILNSRRRVIMIKNWTKYFINFICGFLNTLLAYPHS